ncbi:MAG: histidine--tRNA ligase [Anaerolineae bacterium]|nr:histidine--tRNA ligase [Anaerolineae bacterium]
MPIIQAVKGTRDFYPEQMAFRNWLHGQVRAVSERFGYQEWEAPYLESLDLYAAKSGEELVKEQAFTLTDKGGRVLALRPELTPSLARMIAQRAAELTMPVRWYSFGPFWRYEQPQRGRAREFFQWNIDLLGEAGVRADAEIIGVGVAFLKSVGLNAQQVVVKVNNRQFMQQKLAAMGIAETALTDCFNLIDRKPKMALKAWREYAATLGLSGAQVGSLERLLEDADAWRDFPPLAQLFADLEALDAADMVAFDPTIVRGLLYYTGTVYEANDAAGEYRAILGGGRYDNLIADVGGAPIPATGFAMGDMVMELVLEKYDCKPNLPTTHSAVLVTLFDDALYPQAARLATELRRAGLNTELFLEPARLGKQIRFAQRKNIPVVAILGESEIAAGEVALKRLSTGEQVNVPRAEAPAQVRRWAAEAGS